MISSKEHLEETALEYGLLPFFANNVRGLSVQEMAAPGMLFGETTDDYGCWEWKGPVIRQQTTAYGKFFRNKAGFVSLELLPDFLNYRRAAYPLEPDSKEEMILEIIEQYEKITSTELKRLIFGSTTYHRQATDLVDIDAKRKITAPKESVPTKEKSGRHSLEGPLQKLQMGGRLLIADFQYKYTKRGERYGWGVALYSTPQLWLGANISKCDRTPEESFELLVTHLANKLPNISESQIRLLLK